MITENADFQWDIERRLDLKAVLLYPTSLISYLDVPDSHLYKSEMGLQEAYVWVLHIKDVRQKACDKLMAVSLLEHEEECMQTLDKLERKCIAIHVDPLSRAQTRVRDKKKKLVLSREPRKVPIRLFAGLFLLPDVPLAYFDEKIDELKIRASPVGPEFWATVACEVCSFRPEDDQDDVVPVSDFLKQFDKYPDRLALSWSLTLLGNLDEPTIEEDFGLLKPAIRSLLETRDGSIQAVGCT